MPAIALTDNNNMFGSIRIFNRMYQNGIQPIIGTILIF